MLTSTLSVKMPPAGLKTGVSATGSTTGGSLPVGVTNMINPSASIGLAVDGVKEPSNVERSSLYTLPPNVSVMVILATVSARFVFQENVIGPLPAAATYSNRNVFSVSVFSRYFSK